MEGLSSEASMCAYEASIPTEPERSNAATLNTTTSRRRGGTTRRKAAKRTYPGLPVAAAIPPSPSLSPPEAEDISVPVAKKPRFELPLPATVEEAANVIISPDAEKIVLLPADATMATPEKASSESTLENEVQLIRVGKANIQIKHNTGKECRKEEATALSPAVTLAQASIDMQKRTSSEESGQQPSIDQQPTGLAGPPISTLSLLNIPMKFSNVDCFLTRPANQNKPASMPAGYIPSELDVCAGHGRKYWNLKGNVKFRKIVHASVDRYVAASRRNHKTAVVVSIVDEIRRQGGHFFKEQKHGSSDCWYDIGDIAAREKVGHSIRNIRRQGGYYFKEQNSCRSGCGDDIGDLAACEKVGHSLRELLNAPPKVNQDNSLSRVIRNNKPVTMVAGDDAELSPLVKPTIRMKKRRVKEYRKEESAAVVTAVTLPQQNICMQRRVSSGSRPRNDQ
jgi:hypothetical protein